LIELTNAPDADLVDQIVDLAERVRTETVRVLPDDAFFGELVKRAKEAPELWGQMENCEFGGTDNVYAFLRLVLAKHATTPKQ
jgi:hypothetical protein